jgi:hypothetical protein
MIDKLLQLPLREKAGLGLALVFVALYVTDLTLAKPLLRRLHSLDTAINIETERLESYKKTLSYETSVASMYSSVKDLIGVSGVEQEGIEVFKNEIDEMALQSAIRLKTMRHLTPESTAFLVTYIVEINDFEAETPALINFLHALSRAPGLIRVRKMVLTSQNPDGIVNGSLVITKVMTRASGEGMQ